MQMKIEDAVLGDIAQCARIACDSEIGQRYGFVEETLAARMQMRLQAGDMILVARDMGAIESGSGLNGASGGIIGFAWIDTKGGFGQAPYLKLIAIDASRRSTGAGSLLLSAFEERTKGAGRAWFLLVSDFNSRAIHFYEKHGYVVAGALPDFAKDGITELIMYKRQEA
jgi:ribosomal protein S18 acetylase RimI-like enzyme